MKILLTNDDGFNSKGIRILYNALQKYGDVTLIAPTYHQSGKSASLSFKPLNLIKYDEKIFSLDGTPADCVSFATRYFANDWDIVVSGCNNGLNIVYDTCYSGTIGACIEALIFGIPSIAISTDIDNFDIVEKEIDKVFNYVFTNNLVENGFMLNINFPTIEHLESKGFKLTSIGKRKDEVTWHKQEDGMYVPNRKVIWENIEGEETDSQAVKEGYISITPLVYSHFSEKHYVKLKDKIK